MSLRWSLWLIVLLVVASVWVNLPKTQFIPASVKLWGRQIPLTYLFPVKLGLDLQGGTELTLEADTSHLPSDQQDSALESARAVIERRVNPQGTSEALVQSSKSGNSRRILIELPGVTDLNQATSLVSSTAKLEFKEVDSSAAAELKTKLGTASAQLQPGLIDILSAKSTGLTGADLKKAQVIFGSSTSRSSGPQVQVDFTDQGAKKFADITRRNVGKPLPIFLDDQPVSSPTVQTEIDNGTAVISGNFTTEQAKDLAIKLNAGALPVPVKVLQSQTIPATLGASSVQKSLVAGIIGIVTVMVFMVLYYGFEGLVADLALIIYILVTLAIFRTGLFIVAPITLSLAGIAGFVLSVGMAVDANILTFERIKEEKRFGKPVLLSMQLGFSRSWPSIRDSNISSLITASILYALGTSIVRGFAVTLFIGVLVSMFSAIFVTRNLLRLFYAISK